MGSPLTFFLVLVFEREDLVVCAEDFKVVSPVDEVEAGYELLSELGEGSATQSAFHEM